MRIAHSRKSRMAGFTLLELMAAVAISAVMMALCAPAFRGLKGAGDVTMAAYDIAGVLERARAYATANNTYVWVGLYEEDAVTASPSLPPPFAGKGCVVMAVVASRDGTPIFTNLDSPATIPAASITPIAKLMKMGAVHMTDIGAPTGGDPNRLEGRPGEPYSYSGGPTGQFSRVSSDSADRTSFPFTAHNYTFYKTIRFSPRGEASINGAADLRTSVEIGLQPANGSTPDAASKNDVAIQITGITGSVKVYRR